MDLTMVAIMLVLYVSEHTFVYFRLGDEVKIIIASIILLVAQAFGLIWGKIFHQAHQEYLKKHEKRVRH